MCDEPGRALLGALNEGRLELSTLTLLAAHLLDPCSLNAYSAHLLHFGALSRVWDVFIPRI